MTVRQHIDLYEERGSTMRASNLARAFAATAVLATVLAGPTALAHEVVGQGDLELVVGFGTEPAYSGQPNSVQVIVTHDGHPVKPSELSLDVEVSFGDETTSMALEPHFGPGFGEQGDYRAWFVPAQPGDYTFHIIGQVEGEEVDESVTSGPDTFSPVRDLAGAAFPAITAPSNDELATRIESEATRTDEVELTASAAADDASSAQTTGIVGIVVGAVGILVGIGALVMGRRSPA
jgi:hypothetical protein